MRARISTGVLILLAVAISGAQQQPKVTGFFTDMHYIPGEGDVIGTEVWIVHARDHFYAAVQNAEGEPDPPVVVPVEVSGLRINFIVKRLPINIPTKSTPQTSTHYAGTVSKAGLMLSVDRNPATLLKRQNSYWQ